MKSCLGMLIALLMLVAIIGTLAGLWYLGSTAEFGRKETPAATSTR